MPHRIHTAVNTVQPSPLDPPIDRVRTQPEPRQLRASYNPVLPPGQVRNWPIVGVLVNLTAHYTVK
jgi:hypothetical protein